MASRDEIWDGTSAGVAERSPRPRLRMIDSAGQAPGEVGRCRAPCNDLPRRVERPRHPPAEDVRLAQAPKSVSKTLICELLVLASFTSDGSEQGVKAVAERLRMSHRTTHRYLKTLKTAGLLEQNPVTRKYRVDTRHRVPKRRPRLKVLPPVQSARQASPLGAATYARAYDCSRCR